MKVLKYTLISIAIFDLTLFLISQFNTDLFVSMSPQIHITNGDYNYPRLVGFLMLSLGLPRLYGGLFIKEKGAFIASIWSWVIELVWVIAFIMYGTTNVEENLMPLLLAPCFIIWSIIYYRKNFRTAN
jgi:hypothetical protein